MSNDWSNKNESYKKEIRCYRCNELGHIAPNCPKNGGNINNRINEFKSGIPKTKKFEKKPDLSENADEE